MLGDERVVKDAYALHRLQPEIEFHLIKWRFEAILRCFFCGVIDGEIRDQ
jgi:hypothetical protein